MKKIIVNSGHWDDPSTEHVEDSGARHSHHNEYQLAANIRDYLRNWLKSALYVPDDLDLKKSIVWVNEHAESSDFALSIHLNTNNNVDIRGVEVYYDTDYEIAQEFSEIISRETGLPNRGARHMSESYLGTLGWLTKLKCPSILIEICYLSNKEDREFIIHNQEKAARAIYVAVQKVVLKDEVIVQLRLQLIQLLKEVVRLMGILIGSKK